MLWREAESCQYLRPELPQEAMLMCMGSAVTESLVLLQCAWPM